MSITFSGLGSGLDISSWIEQLVEAKKTSTITPLETKQTELKNQSSALSTIQTSVTSLQTALKSLTDIYSNTSNDLWAKTSVTSDNEAYVSATSSTGLSAGSVKIKVDQIATSTVAQSSFNPAKLINEDTKFSEIGNNDAKGGTFTFYGDNKKYEIEIDKDTDTLGSIMQKISDASGGTVVGKINTDGTFEIASTDGTKVSLGAVSDTSNFKNIMRLTNSSGDSVKSAYALTSFRTNIALTSENSGLSEKVTEGTIKINGVEFEIGGTTALRDLINQINSTKEAKVSAQYDTLTNKLTLTSTETGEFNIALEQEGTNFFDVFGLTEDGALIEGTQTLGKNAIVNINGNEIVSASNTITSETSGIAGLTINAKKVTDGSDKNSVSEVNLDIKSDTTEVKSAIKEFVTAYNKVIEQIKEATAQDGYLEMDSTLRSLQSSMRSMLSSYVSDNGKYGLLSQIGISTGSAGLDVSNTATTLEFDETAFDEAMEADATSVKNLISGGKSGNGKGIFDQMISKIDNVLDSTSGMFKTKSDTLTRMISLQDEKVTKAYERLETYEEQITKQFNAMDETIAKLQSQYSSFLTSSS